MSLDAGFKTAASSKGNRVGFGGFTQSFRPTSYSRSGLSGVKMYAAMGDGPTVTGDTNITMKEDHMDKGFASKLTIEDLGE